MKLDPTGQIVYSTYLGGRGEEFPRQVIVDDSGNIFIIGSTNSKNFPTRNAFIPKYNKTNNDTLFVAKLDNAGKLVYSTYMGRGGESGDPFTLALDNQGNAVITGLTSSRTFPAINAFQTQYGNRPDPKDNNSDVFLVKLDTAGNAVFSTYLGGIGDENVINTKIDAADNIYVIGNTMSKTFPTAHPAQKKFGGAEDGFITKFSPKGDPIYSTFLGGKGIDEIRVSTIDSAGNITVAGKAGSQNFPTANAFQAASGGLDDVFITKLSNSGSIIFSTYLGGSDVELLPNDLRLAEDNNGNIYLSGTTFSTNFPTLNATQATYSDNGDLFLSEIDASGKLLFSTYLGGSGQDAIDRIITDASGNVYLVGVTASTDLPLKNAFQNQSSGNKTFVVAKYSADHQLVYSTYLGGTLGQELFKFTADNSGNLYLMGRTLSQDFPTTANAFQSSPGGGFGSTYDVFITKLDAQGGAVYSTYYGGSGNEDNESIGFYDVDDSGNAYVYGVTDSSDLHTMNALQTSLHGNSDLFLAKFDAAGNADFSTYLGGRGMEKDSALVVAPNGAIYVSGATSSEDFPTKNAAQSSFAGGSQDGFLIEIEP
jgi:hypothetical protein